MKKSKEHEVTTDVINVPSLEKFDGWNKLSTPEQDAVTVDVQEVHAGLQTEAQSKLKVGEHLLRIQKILLPKRLYVKFLDYEFGMSRATAYRYIAQFETGKKLLPQPVLEVAITRGMTLNEDIIKENPAPKTTNLTEINQYLDTVQSQRVPHPVVTDYDTLLKESFNFVLTREARVEGTQKTKNQWHRELIGMLLTRWGIASPMQFNPIAIPEKMETQRGRPKLAA